MFDRINLLGWLVGLLSLVEFTAHGAIETRIGNFYYTAPNGIAFIQGDVAAFVIDPGGSFNAGTVAPDDSFHQRAFLTDRINPPQKIAFTWSRRGDVVFAAIQSEKPGEISFNLKDNWPGFSSHFSLKGTTIEGVAVGRQKDVTWHLISEPPPKSADDSQLTLEVGGPGHPTYFIAGFGALPSFSEIGQVLKKAQEAYEISRPKAEGPSGDIIGAITDNLDNSRIYSNDNNLVAISVSRNYGDSPNDCPYFCWDSFFNALLASLDNPAIAHQTVRAILSSQGADGLVPNVCHWFGPVRASMDRSQPPVGALCVWKMNQRQPDPAFLREVYPKLVRWHAWWMKARDAKHDGLLEWGDSAGDMQKAQYETGWDDTPQFEGVDGCRMVGPTMNAYAVDLCSLWAMDAQYLGLIADAIGKPADAQKYRQEEIDMNRRINDRLWNEKLGCYCSRFWNDANEKPGAFLTRLTPANFYPLISGAPDAQRAKQVLAIMSDPTRFWGQWILPTVSRQDPLFPGQHYWHGTIWGPVNYLIFQGVKRYAPPGLEASFAEKSVRLFMNNWRTYGYCGENFRSTDGTVCDCKNYTWGALLALIGIESVVDIDDRGIPHLGPGYHEPVRFTGLPIEGHRYTIHFSPDDKDSTITPETR